MPAPVSFRTPKKEFGLATLEPSRKFLTMEVSMYPLQVVGLVIFTVVVLWIFLPLLARNIIRKYFSEKRAHLQKMLGKGDQETNISNKS